MFVYHVTRLSEGGVGSTASTPQDTANPDTIEHLVIEVRFVTSFPAPTARIRKRLDRLFARLFGAGGSKPLPAIILRCALLVSIVTLVTVLAADHCLRTPVYPGASADTEPSSCAGTVADCPRQRRPTSLARTPWRDWIQLLLVGALSLYLPAIIANRQHLFRLNLCLVHPEVAPPTPGAWSARLDQRRRPSRAKSRTIHLAIWLVHPRLAPELLAPFESGPARIFYSNDDGQSDTTDAAPLKRQLDRLLRYVVITRLGEAPPIDTDSTGSKTAPPPRPVCLAEDTQAALRALSSFYTHNFQVRMYLCLLVLVLGYALIYDGLDPLAKAIAALGVLAWLAASVYLYRLQMRQVAGWFYQSAAPDDSPVAEYHQGDGTWRHIVSAYFAPNDNWAYGVGFNKTLTIAVSVMVLSFLTLLASL